MEIYFLTLDDVVEIYSDQIKRYGGKSKIRDHNLLLSAIGQPLSTFDGQYLHKTLFDQAGAYLFHICKNHPFVDGNKRTALVCALIFLAMNDCPFHYQEAVLEKLIRSIAEGTAKKDEALAFFSKILG